MRPNLTMAAFAAAAMLGFSASATASDGHACPVRAEQTALDGPALARTLSSAGLTQIGSWEREDGCVETRARTADGWMVELILDPYAGTVPHREEARTGDRERDDDDDGRGDENEREQTERRS